MHVGRVYVCMNVRMYACTYACVHVLRHPCALGRIVLRLVLLQRGLAGLRMTQSPLQLLNLGYVCMNARMLV